MGEEGFALADLDRIASGDASCNQRAALADEVHALRSSIESLDRADDGAPVKPRTADLLAATRAELDRLYAEKQAALETE